MSDPVEVVGVLHDPVRRAVYRHVVDQAVAVGRNEVAEALGMGRTLAAFHLDKLADAGLVEVSYARRSGRSGPGAGRPAKLYRRAEVEHAVSLPPRAYETAAEVLAEAVDRAGADDLLQAAARRRGAAIGAATDRTADVATVLAGLGY